MPEALTDYEKEVPWSPDQVARDVAAHFERVGHPISPEQLDWLVDDIQIADLSDDPLTERVGRVPLAKIEGATITFDQRYEQLSPEQQRYVLTHEYSHSINSFFASREDNESYIRLSTQVSSIPVNQVSSYVGYLAKELRPSSENLAFLEEEKMAEVIAQYLTSDRTFTGFMMAKLLQFEASLDAESELVEFRSGIEEIRDLGAYLDTVESDDDREAFLDYHQGLRAQYELWQSIAALFEETDFSELDAEAQAAWLDQSSWEDEELGAELHAETLGQNQVPRTMLSDNEQPSSPRTPFADLLTFWKLYP